MSDVLTVKTLGKFSVSIGDTVISDNSTRSHKVWKIFKYLITNRHKMVTVEALIDVLWPDEGPDNPQKSLYTLMSRLRKLLNTGGDVNYILFQHDSYQWDPKLPIDLDVADFEHWIKLAEGLHTDEEKVPLLKNAIEIYTGDYMGESAFEIWILPVTNYYKRIYMRSLSELAEIYSRAGDQDEIIQLCNKAIEIEPFEESLHERLIKALFINGEMPAAKQIYKRFTEAVKKEFGAEPSEEFRASCGSMLSIGNKQLNLTTIKKKLDGESRQNGAYFCTADIFNQIYVFDKRSDERMKFPIFLALITVEPELHDSNEEKSLRSAMLTLRQCLMGTLRGGDIVSQYSKNQFLLMLSARLLEDAKTAMSRVKGQFENAGAGIPCKILIHLSQIGK